MGKKKPEYYNYYGSEAEDYGTSKWMKRNQAETTSRALELLDSELFEDSEIEYESSMALDIGAGTGFSTEIIKETGLNVIAMDLSYDMLKQNQCLFCVLADMRQLPFRDNIFDIIISISAFNFTTSGAKSLNEKKKFIDKSISELYRVSTERCKIAIEFYPEQQEIEMFLESAKRCQFTGGLMIDNPNAKTEKKFLLLKKHKNNS